MTLVYYGEGVSFGRFPKGNVKLILGWRNSSRWVVPDGVENRKSTNEFMVKESLMRGVSVRGSGMGHTIERKLVI